MCKFIRFPIALRVVMGLLLFSVFGYENVALAEKQVVAVGRIDYRAKDTLENIEFKSKGYEVREDSRAFRNMLTTALVQTNKFKVVEREEEKLMEVFNEQEAAIDGIAREGFAGDSLQTRGVDYILTGAITEFGYVGGGKVAFDLVQDKSAVLSVDLRLIKVRTGAVGFAGTVRSKAGGGISVNRGGNESGHRSKGDILGETLRKAANRAASLIAVSVYPVKIVGINTNGVVMLNYGEPVLSQGDRLDVFKLGDEMIDPDTEEILGQEKELVGKIQVVSVSHAVSKAKVLDVIGELSEGMVARKDSKRPWESGSLKLVKPHKEELF